MLDERASCPRCKSRRCLSNGSTRWMCKDCGKQWNKTLYVELDNYELERYNQAPELHGDHLIIGDVHVPFHCPKTSSHAIELAAKWKIKKVVVVGDLFELETFKKYLDSHPQINWKYEKAAGVKFLTVLLKLFDEITLLIGNHELRLWKRLEGSGDQDDVYKMFITNPQIKPYTYPYAVINNSWLVQHPKSYSRIQSRNPYFLASKYMIDILERGKSPNGQYGLIAFHGHLGGEGTDVSSRFRVADGMGLFDPDLFSYQVLKISTGPKWRKGFYLLRNNYLYPFPEEHTDWEYYLGKK